MNTINSGILETLGGFSATLDGSTASGAITISTGSTYLSPLNSTTNLLGTITNNGDIQVNGGASTNTLLNIGSNVTLQGPGTVTLSTATGSGAAFIEQSGGNFCSQKRNTVTPSDCIPDGRAMLFIH